MYYIGGKMIDILNLDFEYPNKNNSHEVLKNINLSIKEREIITILGPSGCGKTTLAKLIAGHLKYKKGKILKRDKSINSPGKDRILIAQEDSLFPWMTLGDNIKYFCDNDKKVDKLLRMVHLEPYKGYYPSQISGGMKKRISMVRALAADPEIIIMDEAFSFLDYLIKQRIYKEILYLWEISKKTYLLTPTNKIS
jgi:ABC-type nitrate/sulfonate/bicarbonate transport system ATPase subunit